MNHHDKLVRIRQLTDYLHELRGDILACRQNIASLASQLAAAAYEPDANHDFIATVSDTTDAIQGYQDDIMDLLAKVDDAEDERASLTPYVVAESR